MASMHEALQKYAAKLGFPGSETLAEIFAILYDDDTSLKVISAMPGSCGEISERTGLPVETVRAAAERLKNRGAVNRVLSKPDAYRLFPAMIELRDATVLDPGYPPRLYELWDVLVREEMPKIIPALRGLGIPPIMRVVPIEQTVEQSGRVLDVDSARTMFSGAGLITAIPCPCRSQARKMGRGKDCPAPETSMCMQINGFAEAVLDRGIGEKLTNREALRRIGDAEDAGLVHLVRNNVKEDMFMCNCCSCCCTGMFLIHHAGYAESYAPSRFRVKLDERLCTGCGLCESRCQFRAIKTGDIAIVDKDKCYGCGNCVLSCPAGALVLEEIHPREHIRTT